MGVSLFAITRNKFNFQEIINLQDTIESDNELRQLWWGNKCKTENWKNVLMSQERLTNFWNHNEEQTEIDDIFLFDYLPLPTFFGELTFHRNIVELQGFGQKLWILDTYSKFSQNILNFNRRLGTILKQDKIIYYGDSWAKSSWVNDWIYNKTMGEILQQLNSLGFGQIKDINKSIADEHLYIHEL